MEENQNIQITKRQASICSAAILLMFLFVFIVGYFLGKQSICENFVHRIDEDVVKDQVDYLVATQNPQTVQDSVPSAKVSESTSDSDSDKVVAEKTLKHDVLPKERYFVRLAGFGVKKTAQEFAARLKQRNIVVKIKTRKSKTASGKIRKWYQAVTDMYDSREILMRVVEKIKRLENIRNNDIKIIAVKLDKDKDAP